MRPVPLVLSLALVLATLPCARAAQHDDAVALTKKAVVVDTHIDAPTELLDQWHDLGEATPSREFDYPRARAGGLDVAFMSIYTSAEEDEAGKARQIAHTQIDAVEALAARHPDKFALVRSPRDIERLQRGGRVLLALGMENGAPIVDQLSELARFHARGVRYITLAHGKNNRISDSATDAAPRWNGLSPFGREVVAEMNRLGIMVDVSHLSEQAIGQAVELSTVPVIASHSALRHFTPGFQRNLSDEMVKAIAAKGGVVQVPFGLIFVDDAAAKTYSAFLREREAFRQARATAVAEGRPVAGTEPEFPKFQQSVSYSSVLDNIDRIVELAGVDHAGVGSDFDGVNGALVAELRTVADYPVLVAGLKERGYSDADVRKILGGNLLRVWRAVEDASKHD
ncbi:dipeptidase [Agrilutibacter solisilvae]|uniref:Dipeptidase n=1 Tax=Agrilutibacter solisilvae TaxID=2763317 RepID=A0A974XW21_9GAMM|nr:dipeptidase [Lysobacter solisilvae]QSX76949.1 dipeptidase [Lysobacter solisilvae]